MTQADDRNTDSGRGSVPTPVRFVLHWVIKSVVLLLLGVRFLLRPRAVRYGLVALVAVAAIGWRTTGFSLNGLQAAALPSGSPPASTISVPATNQLPPSPVVERYLQAQAAFDGKGMWDLISDEMKSSMQTSGNISLQQLQQELDSARQQGRRYSSAVYVGGVPMTDGQSVYFYVLKVDSPSGSTEVPYIYIVGPDNKIASIQ